MARPGPKKSLLQKNLDRDVRAACAHLRGCDPVMATLIDRYGTYRLEARTNYFQLLMGTVVSQQLSTKAAASIYARLQENLGTKSPRPGDVLAAREADLRSAGLSGSKVTYIRNVAEAFAKPHMGPKSFEKRSDSEVTELLTSIKGIGEWSADMFLMFALNRMNVFPVGDLGLRNAMVRQYRMRKTGSLRRFHRIAERWQPYRTVGSLYLWQSYDSV